MGSRVINRWEPDNFELETNTVWNFPQRGYWATHDSQWRGNWSPYIPRNIILRYSQEGDLLLDQFAGGGTTLIEAKLLNRNAIGVDINPDAIKHCKEKTDFSYIGKEGRISLYRGDARNLNALKDGSVDLICTHPPYANIIRYSENIKADLSHLPINEFLKEMTKVAEESYRVLKENKVCAILMGIPERMGT